MTLRPVSPTHTVETAAPVYIVRPSGRSGTVRRGPADAVAAQAKVKTSEIQARQQSACRSTTCTHCRPRAPLRDLSRRQEPRAVAERQPRPPRPAAFLFDSTGKDLRHAEGALTQGAAMRDLAGDPRRSSARSRMRRTRPNCSIRFKSGVSVPISIWRHW